MSFKIDFLRISKTKRKTIRSGMQLDFNIKLTSVERRYETIESMLLISNLRLFWSRIVAHDQFARQWRC